MSDLERQLDEMEVLASIYDSDLILAHKWPSAGCLRISPVPVNDYIDLNIITVVDEQKLEKTTRLKYLPPIELYFNCPPSYPSVSQPFFMLNCNWLSDDALTSICQQLDIIWDRHGGEILYEWAYFLKEDSIPFLKIEKLQFTLDMSIVETSDSFPSVNPPDLRLKELPNRIQSEKKVSGDLKPNVRRNKLMRRRTKKNYSSDYFKYETPKDALIRTNIISSETSQKTDDRLDPSCSSKTPGCKKTNGEDSLATIQLDYILNMMHIYGVRRPTSLKSDCRVLHVKKQSQLQPLQQRPANSTQDAFDIVNYLIDYNDECLHKIFCSEWHDCEVCLEQKKGTECIRMLACNHIFCSDCTKEYLRVNIINATVSLRCPSVDCETFFTPIQIRQIVNEETFDKYETFLQKVIVENDPSLMYCPRPICQSVARRCPELSPDICYCSRCSFYFCMHCKKTYHGVQPCQVKNEARRLVVHEYQDASPERQAELEKRYSKQQIREWVDEYLSEEWFETKTRPCPNCKAPIQKNAGCNKMLCSNCTIPFCWLCNKCLSSAKPYNHFSDPDSSCYQKLITDYEYQVFDNEDGYFEEDDIFDEYDEENFEDYYYYDLDGPYRFHEL